MNRQQWPRGAGHISVPAAPADIEAGHRGAYLRASRGEARPMRYVELVRDEKGRVYAENLPEKGLLRDFLVLPVRASFTFIPPLFGLVQVWTKILHATRQDE